MIGHLAFSNLVSRIMAGGTVGAWTQKRSFIPRHSWVPQVVWELALWLGRFASVSDVPQSSTRTYLDEARISRVTVVGEWEWVQAKSPLEASCPYWIPPWVSRRPYPRLCPYLLPFPWPSVFVSPPNQPSLERSLRHSTSVLRADHL